MIRILLLDQVRYILAAESHFKFRGVKMHQLVAAYLIGLVVLLLWNQIHTVIAAVLDFFDDVNFEICYLRRESGVGFLISVVAYPLVMIALLVAKLIDLYRWTAEKFRKQSSSATS